MFKVQSSKFRVQEREDGFNVEHRTLNLEQPFGAQR